MLDATIQSGVSVLTIKRVFACLLFVILLFGCNQDKNSKSITPQSIDTTLATTTSIGSYYSTEINKEEISETTLSKECVVTELNNNETSCGTYLENKIYEIVINRGYFRDVANVLLCDMNFDGKAELIIGELNAKANCNYGVFNLDNSKVVVSFQMPQSFDEVKDAKFYDIFHKVYYVDNKTQNPYFVSSGIHVIDYLGTMNVYGRIDVTDEGFDYSDEVYLYENEEPNRENKYRGDEKINPFNTDDKDMEHILQYAGFSVNNASELTKNDWCELIRKLITDFDRIAL
jgi:hypothetical protein